MTTKLVRFCAIFCVVFCAVSASSYFIHISDPHIDFNYKEGTNVNCALMDLGWPCCHNWSSHLSPAEQAPKYGFRNCDIPPDTFQVLVEAMAKEYPNPFLVLLTGDLTSHDAFYEYPEHIADKWDFVFTTVKKYFGEDVKIISTIGNHDVFPADQASDNKTDEVVTDLLNVMYNHGVLHKGVPDEDIFSLRGYYKTSIPNTNVDAVVMNNIIDLRQNRWTDKTNRDPGGMYSWMQKAVADSAAAGRKVWLVGHVAPTYEMELVRGVSAVERLVDAFARNGTLTAGLYGHTHHDEFMLTGMESLQDKPDFVSILAPGVTCKSDINPSIRAVDVDGDDLTLIDWHQYHMEINASNDARKVIFNHVYDFRAYYDVPDLSPKSFQTISQRTLTSESYAIKYLNARSTINNFYGSCDEDCRKQVYCNTSFRESSSLHMSCLFSSYKQLVASLNSH